MLHLISFRGIATAATAATTTTAAVSPRSHSIKWQNTAAGLK